MLLRLANSNLWAGKIAQWNKWEAYINPWKDPGRFHFTYFPYIYAAEESAENQPCSGERLENIH